jgi:hypothetical protein
VPNTRRLRDDDLRPALVACFVGGECGTHALLRADFDDAIHK